MLTISKRGVPTAGTTHLLASALACCLSSTTTMMVIHNSGSTDSNETLSPSSVPARQRGAAIHSKNQNHYPMGKGVAVSINDIPTTPPRTSPSPLSRLVNHPRHKNNLLLAAVSALCLLLLCGIGTLLGTTDNNRSALQKNVRIQNITAVIMNHARPRNLQESELLPTLLANPHITEILLLHSNPATAFHYDHFKVKNFNATKENDKMGLSLRFWFAGHKASNDRILLVDDDMIIPSTTLSTLIMEYSTNPNRIVGRFGRQICWYWRTGLLTNGYNTYNARGPTEVVLTKIMLMEKSICRQFHVYSHLVEQDLVKGSVPYWNGEDIFMNLVANHVYGNTDDAKYSETTKSNAKRGRNNYAMPWLPIGDVEDRYKETNTGRLDVSGNFKGMRWPWTWKFWNAEWRNQFYKAYMHLYYRGNLWRNAKQRLQKEGIIHINYKNNGNNQVGG